jgi:hypothetical protein
MKISGRHFRTFWVTESGTVQVIDQSRLPFEFATIDLETLADAARAIKTMVVRGAPLIGATAAYAMALAARTRRTRTSPKRLESYKRRAPHLRATDCSGPRSRVWRSSARTSRRKLIMPGVDTPSTYRILDTDTVPGLIRSLTEIRALLGGQPESWWVHEVGDGNLNLIFIVQGRVRLCQTGVALRARCGRVLADDARESVLRSFLLFSSCSIRQRADSQAVPLRSGALLQRSGVLIAPHHLEAGLDCRARLPDRGPRHWRVHRNGSSWTAADAPDPVAKQHMSILVNPPAPMHSFDAAHVGPAVLPPTYSAR